MRSALLQPGRAYSFEYPRYNYQKLPNKLELRRVRVTAVRDTQRDPLDDITESLNPLLRRGRMLVIGDDLDKAVERSFYVDSMLNIQSLSDDDLQPLKGAEYLVIDQTRVAFKSQSLGDAVRHRLLRPFSTICAVLCHGPRDVDLDVDPPDC